MTVETITAKQWQEKVRDSVLPVVVNFSAVRCGFCQALEPLYNRLSEQYNGKLEFLKLIGYTIEPKLTQKIEMFLSEMEFCIKNSTGLTNNLSQK
jgi:thiol-disulfide isomerase/thioredoxin